MAWPELYPDPYTDRDIEVYARALYDVLVRLTGDVHGKSYDPLTIERSPERQTAHSYYFDLWDGGRHHDLTGKTNRDVLDTMLTETCERLKPEGRER